MVGSCAQMVQTLRQELAAQQTAEQTSVQAKAANWELQRQQRDKRYHINNLGGGVFQLTGTTVERMVVQTDWDNDEAILYLQHRFERMGIDDALYKAGCRNGDEVRILGYSFEFGGFDDEAR